MIRLFKWTLVAIAAGSLVACDDDPPTSSGPCDTTPPAIAGLTPIDVLHLEIVFSEDVALATAEMGSHYEIVEVDPPNDENSVVAAVLAADGKTVLLSTYESMSGLSLSLTVNGVTDLHGNATSKVRSSFTGSDVPDSDPPHVVRSSPTTGATEVPIGTSVLIRFSESIDDNTFEQSVAWSSPTGPVRFYRSHDYGPGTWNPSFTLVAPDLLEYNALQTITFSGVRDLSGNIMPEATISFTTTDTMDDTPPVLVSSVPRDGATHVSVNTPISLMFSEPINRFDFQFEEAPQILFDDWAWSDDGRTVTYTIRDDIPLVNDRQHKILLYPGGVYDLGGRTLAEFQTITFTTGDKLETASIKGRVAGHPETAAADPMGAVVIGESWLWETFGVAYVDEDGDYTLSHLDWGPYYVRGYLDTNHDGFVYIDTGDAFGGYGADLASGDLELEDVPVPESHHVNDIDFAIYDPAAVSGIVSFPGELPYRPIGVGLFSTLTDVTNLTNPIATYHARWPHSPEWVLNEVWNGFEEGNYYLAAYIDADSSLAYEPGIDPAGVYGGDSPTIVHLVNGVDYFDIVIPVDYAPAKLSERVTWPQLRQDVELQRLHYLLGKRDPNSLFAPLTKKDMPQPTASQ